MGAIHPTAIVDPKATLGDNVSIGPYCTVGADVVLGDNVELVSHVVVAGRTEIGANSRIFPFAAVGLPPQDLKYKGEPSRLVIGRDTIIREHATLNPGTKDGGMLTKVGDGGLFMVGSHVAHDCLIGNKVILVNNATLGGHVQVGDFAIFGGLSAVHQRVRIGQHAVVGGMTGVEGDVIPYGLVMGDRARLAGLNLVGLKRRGFTREQIHALRAAYRMLFAAEGTLAERLDDVTEMFGTEPAVMDIVNFIRADANRAICQPAGAKNGGGA
jgi:UDP-N-acetylglucosamine acyltransferase